MKPIPEAAAAPPGLPRRPWETMDVLPPIRELPRTRAEFVGALEHRNLAEAWRIYQNAKGALYFHPPACDGSGRAVSYEWPGGLWVNMGDRERYPFMFDRLYEDYGSWSWWEQVQEKNWCADTDLALLRALYELFPANLYAARFEPR